MDQSDRVPSQITANRDSQKKILFHWVAPVCETRQTKLEYVLQWVSTSKAFMTIFKYTYEQ
jgi:hypothetical protein